jgi:hypothetical protein
MPLPPRISRLVSLALASCIVLLVWSIAIDAPLRSLAADHQDFENLAALNRRDNFAESSLPVLKRELAQIQASKSLSRMLLDYNEPAILAAELQRRGNAMIAASGAQVMNSRTIPVVPEAGHLQIGLLLDVSATPGALQALLYAFETSSPLLTVDHLVIETPDSGAPPLAPDGQPLLIIHIQVSAYARAAS